MNRAEQVASSAPPLHAVSPAGKTRRGFTLIELLVVIGIIVVLIGLLVGALGHAKNKAREAGTQALLSNLSSDIDAYHTDFQAYPGPLPATVTSGNSNRVTGTQNMMLGLSYALSTASGAPNISIPSATGLFNGLPLSYVDPTTYTGPKNYARIDPVGNPTQHGAYFNPTAKQVTSFAYNAGFLLPVVVDTYTDGMPVLYYRRSPGVERSVNSKVVEANTGVAIAPYYLDDNKEYTSGSVMTTSGTAFTQNLLAADLEALVSTGSGNTIGARGGYVLISAGTDRIFGTAPNGKKDDVVIVGGN